MPVTAKANVDYVATGGSISLVEGQLSTSVDISIIDNSKPELNKTFRVELYGAKEGGKGVCMFKKRRECVCVNVGFKLLHMIAI